MNCTGLTEITIPENIKTIGFRAFYCENLTKITWKNTTYTDKTKFNTALKNAKIATDNAWI